MSRGIFEEAHRRRPASLSGRSVAAGGQIGPGRVVGPHPRGTANVTASVTRLGGL